MKKTNREVFLEVTQKSFPKARLDHIPRTDNLDSIQLIEMFAEIQRVHGPLSEEDIRDVMIAFDDTAQVDRGDEPQGIVPGTKPFDCISCFATVVKQRIG